MALTFAGAVSFPKLLLLRRPKQSPYPSSFSPSLSISSLPFFVPALRCNAQQPSADLAVAEEEAKAVESEQKEEDDGEEIISGESRNQDRPCELYVCNLPRSCDVSQLLELFKPYGTIFAVEVSRDIETGLSRGSGYVTMSSIQEAKAAIAALDCSDFGGRELRIQFSADVAPRRPNADALNTGPKKDFVFESPYKAYVGNLAWSVKPQHLREHFSQFGTVVSARVLHDRKGGRSRVYGFLSFSSADELKSAIETSGSDFHGRELLVREVVSRSGS